MIRGIIRFIIYTLAAVLYLTALGCDCTKLQVETGDKSSSLAALNQLQKIQEQAKQMRYGECWTEALQILKSGCRVLTDETQRRIAYAFMRCHLVASGREIKNCPEDKSISECTAADVLPDLAFNTYTEFFTHSQQICFHLQSQTWHEETEQTIDRLADNSKQVASRLEDSAVIAKEMFVRQNKSLKNQEELLRNEERLKISLQQSVFDVQKSHQETKQIISEQRALFSEVFDRVAVLQKTVLGEFSGIYTFAFYIGSTLLAYILTSTLYTSGARIWLFLILILNAVTERAITSYHISDLDGKSDLAAGTMGMFMPELIYERVWMCRQFFCALALLVLIISLYRFKDYNKINNNLLNEIRKQNMELQQYIKDNIHENSQSPSSVVVKTEAEIHNVALGKEILFQKLHQTPPDAIQESFNETLVAADDSVMKSHLSTIDLTDDDSDCTFHQSDIIGDSDRSSILSVSSRSSISTVCPTIERRSSTPLRESPLVHDISTHSHDTSVHHQFSVKKTSRRSSIIATLNDSSRSIEPPSDSVTIGGYNLRSRARKSYKNCNILQKETVQEFTAYMLNGLAEQSAAKRNTIRKYLENKK